MKGWWLDPHLHSLAARGISFKPAKRDASLTSYQVSYAQILGAGLFLRPAQWYSRHAIPFSCVLHGIDLVDTKKHVVLPGAPWYSRLFFEIPYSRKIDVVRRILHDISTQFDTLTLSEWIAQQNPSE